MSGISHVAWYERRGTPRDVADCKGTLQTVRHVACSGVGCSGTGACASFGSVFLRVQVRHLTPLKGTTLQRAATRGVLHRIATCCVRCASASCAQRWASSPSRKPLGHVAAALSSVHLMQAVKWPRRHYSNSTRSTTPLHSTRTHAPIVAPLISAIS